MLYYENIIKSINSHFLKEGYPLLESNSQFCSRINLGTDSYV